MAKPKLGPASKKQEMFLQSESDITVFGGANKSSGSTLNNPANSREAKG